MLKTIEILVEYDLVEEVIRRYHLADAREAVHLALRTLLNEDEAEEAEHDDEYDEFSDLSAWEPHRSPHGG